MVLLTSSQGILVGLCVDVGELIPGVLHSYRISFGKTLEKPPALKSPQRGTNQSFAMGNSTNFNN